MIPQTFAGGRINQTLKYAIEWQGSWKVVADNFSVKIQGDGTSQDAVTKVLDGLRAPGFWDDLETPRKLLYMVPEYRLSKFQRVLPDVWQVERVHCRAPKDCSSAASQPHKEQHHGRHQRRRRTWRQA